MDGSPGNRDRNLPPLPWSWEDNGARDRPLGSGFVYLLDANGRKIGTLWGKPAEKAAAADFIVGASEKAASGGSGGAS